MEDLQPKVPSKDLPSNSNKWVRDIRTSTDDNQNAQEKLIFLWYQIDLIKRIKW